MNIVADTNIFLAVALDEPGKADVVRLTMDATLLAPEVLPYEVGNALSAMVKRGRLSQEEALEAEKMVSAIPVRLTSADIQGSLQMACEHQIYAYDAYFLHCARAFGCPLLTFDRRMSQVAGQLGIEVLE